MDPKRENRSYQQESSGSKRSSVLPCRENTPEPVPRVFPWLVVCAILALLIDLGRFHASHHGDTLIPVLCSLYHWTPFYWEQDRLGSLLPLLALPAPSLCQSAGAMRPGHLFRAGDLFLVASVCPARSTWPLVGALGVLGFLVLTPEYYRFTFMAGHQPYFTSLALGLGGLIATERAGTCRTAIGLSLLMLAHWVHLGAFTVFIPLVLIRRLLLGPGIQQVGAEEQRIRSRWSRWRQSEVGRHFSLLCISSLAGIALNRISRYHHEASGYGLLPPREWLSSWSRMTGRAWAQFEDVPGPSWPVVLLLAAGLGLVWAFCRSDRSTCSHLFRACLVFEFAAIANALATGSTHWARINYFDPRYWTATIILLQAALVVFAVWPLLSKWNPRVNRGLGLATIPVLIGVTIAMYGVPSTTRVRGIRTKRWVHKHRTSLPRRALIYSAITGMFGRRYTTPI